MKNLFLESLNILIKKLNW